MKNILIIDDDETICKLFQVSLQDNDFEIDIAFNGDEGLKILKEKEFHLVITDIVMPEKEGIETIGEIKLKYPDIKIIAISGGGRGKPENYLKIADLMGVNKTFQKPVDVFELQGYVKQLLSE